VNSYTDAREPVTTLAGFSSEGAVATTWARGRTILAGAEVYWVSSVRPDGRPHVTPLLGIWLNGAMYFCTGDNERKAKNLAENPHCILTTGCNNLDGLDMVVEGAVTKVSDKTELQSAGTAYESKYGSRFTAPEGTWFGLGDSIRQGKVLVYRLAPTRALGFAKGRTFSQTRWEFHGSRGRPTR
jgi:hypothetical protein